MKGSKPDLGAGDDSPVRLHSVVYAHNGVINPLRATLTADVPGDVPTASSLAMTTRAFLQSLVISITGSPKEVWGPDQGVLLYKGLRVRIGVTAGVADATDVVINPHSGRLQYAGRALAVASAISSVGHGGMVVLSADTFAKVRA